jgi:hypothetical protein
MKKHLSDADERGSMDDMDSGEWQSKGATLSEDNYLMDRRATRSWHALTAN